MTPRPAESNVLIGPGVLFSDRELFFGPLVPGDPNDEFIEADPATRYPELLHRLGFFASRSDARRNGWDRDIPDGWTDLRIGKLRRRVCVLKIVA